MRWLGRQPCVPSRTASRTQPPPLLLLKYVAAAHRNSRRLGADGRLAPDAGRAESRYADLLPCTS